LSTLTASQLTACSFEAASNPKVCFVHKIGEEQERKPPLPPLQTLRIGFSALLATQPQCPGQPWLQGRSAFSPSTQTSLVTAATAQEQSDTTGQRDRCSSRLKEEAFAPTRASSSLRLPQEKPRQKFFRDAKKP